MLKEIDQSKTPLFDALKAYHEREVIPFDVPGHKHGKGLAELAEYLGPKVLEVDVNAMECLDNICNPIGVIKEAEDLAAKAYGGEHAYFLVNGTSSGVQAMILACCNPGDKIILPRNAHKSAISAIILSGAIPIYIQPEIQDRLGIAMGVSLESVKNAIEEHPDAKAIFMINPTYYGVVSDLQSIVTLAHQKGMLVLADEAHGAHMHFHEEFPLSAIAAGADMSAISIHKTGGSLTQSSLLVLNSKKVAAESVKSVLNLTQTTSASYLLMISLDIARKQLATKGKELLDGVLELSRYARNQINEIGGYYAFGKELIGTPGTYDFDESKLGINVKDLGLTGYEIERILKIEYNIQVEIADLSNILCIISLGDQRKSIDILIQALKDIKKKYGKQQAKDIITPPLRNPELIVSPRDAYYSLKRVVKLRDAIGEVSGESIMAYPPGIPVITPGEKITEEIVDYIEALKEQRSMLQGTEDPYVNNIKILGQQPVG
ncbi:aminotransferase class I/II-fold pyridoxal phosphate-dependent enzyme [Garciella nitratireducens]|uniref:aminotransferase class I/II-fold pyridoxal phosphate-dependent enzyme n=1 Tax=Garciella nitratireducens TaxID=218205 RepID=UPI000DE9799D|nr:aminotransferase class I/II-fold pyridoxal phosphate-dependent enzyme [Garciella nitratireducens]